MIRPITEPLKRPIRLGILFSGGGTTLLNLVEKIEAGELDAEIVTAIASRADCKGVERAKAAGIETHVVSRREFENIDDFSESVFNHLREANVDLVLFAGFLSLIKIPDDYAHRVFNIHPSLIPAFCGKGFYGHHVHEAAIARGVKVSGCTIHFADNEYDHGPIVLQKSVPVEEGDTADNLAARVFEAECIAYPEAVQLFAQGRISIDGQRVKISPPVSS